MTHDEFAINARLDWSLSSPPGATTVHTRTLTQLHTMGHHCTYPKSISAATSRKLTKKQQHMADQEVLLCPFSSILVPDTSIPVAQCKKKLKKGKNVKPDYLAHRRTCPCFENRPGQQAQLFNNGTHVFTGRNLDNFRMLTSHIWDLSDSDSDSDSDSYEDDEAEIEDVVHHTHSTSGAALLAIARPVKTRRPLPQTTDGEAFEIIEIDGRLVAFDEDDWEILSDEGAGASFLYSDVVRGNAR